MASKNGGGNEEEEASTQVVDTASAVGSRNEHTASRDYGTLLL